MIRLSALIYETVNVPAAPELRRSSRNDSIEYTYREHENIKKYYKNKRKDLKNIVTICKNIKYVKYRKMIIERLMIEKYGDSFGSLITKIITEEYLIIPYLKINEYENTIYEQCHLYLKSGLLPKTINDTDYDYLPYREKNKYLKSLIINL